MDIRDNQLIFRHFSNKDILVTIEIIELESCMCEFLRVFKWEVCLKNMILG